MPAPDADPDLALDTSQPFTTAAALGAGITPGDLRGPRFRQLFKGVYIADVHAGSPLLLARAALSTQPGNAFASHFSAARICELPVPSHPDEHVSVLTPDDRRRRKGVDCHVATPGAKVIRIKGVRLSPPRQLLVELAANLGLVDLVILGDAIVGKRWHTPDELVAACRDSNDKHARRAEAAARFVRAGVDSPMETRLRMLIVLAGLPEPDVNHTVRDERGNVVRRFDLSYPGLKLVIEYDGRQHAEDPDQYDSDIYRREELDRWGWRLVTVTSKGIYRKPDETLHRIHLALKERGAKGLPRRLSDEWRRHFPVHRTTGRAS